MLQCIYYIILFPESFRCCLKCKYNNTVISKSFQSCLIENGTKTTYQMQKLVNVLEIFAHFQFVSINNFSKNKIVKLFCFIMLMPNV